MRKHKIIAAIIFLCCFIIVSCDSDSVKEENLTPSMAYIVNNGFHDVEVFTNEDSYTYKLGIYKSGALKSEASVKLAMFTEEEINAYNAENNTPYKMLPSSYYTMEKTEVYFSKDRNDVSQVLDIEFNILSMKDLSTTDTYVLPFKIAEASIPVNQDKSDIFIHLTLKEPVIPVIDRKDWTVADFNTEEATGENGGKNGRAQHMIDGDNKTFWHSKWSDGEGKLPPVPHYVVFDMQKEYIVTQMDLTRREGKKDLKAGEFWLSTDNKEFTKIGDFTLADTNNEQYFPVTPTKGRYLKIIMTESNHKDQCTSLAELMAHGYTE